MRVFVAGGTGVIGVPLVQRLLAVGHDVGVLARSPGSAERVRRLGAEPVEGDALNERSLQYAVRTYRPEVVINQLTSLPRNLLNLYEGMRSAELTNRLRSESTPVLVEAAAAEGAERVITQSISFAQQPGPGVRSEEDPLYLDAPGVHGDVVRALAAAESATLDTAGVEGIVLRYGAFYGPGSYFAAGESYPRMLERRALPIIGEGRGIWALVHIEDAVDATITALRAESGVFNITDDAPVAAAELLPWMAYALGTSQPRRVSRSLFGFGPLTILRYLVDEQPEVSTKRAHSRLGWAPRHEDWRHSLARVLRGE